MEDKRGEEHIKLATEYGKTQLNSGHLVDNQEQRRGAGAELHTNEGESCAPERGCSSAQTRRRKRRATPWTWMRL